VFNTSSTTVGTVNTLFSTLANIINASTTGLTTSNLYGTNSIITNSTSTNFFATNAIFTNATTSNFFTTNFSATNGNFTGLTSVNSTSTNATSTNLFSTNAFFTNATTTNLGVLGKTTLANASGTALSLSSNLYVTGQTALTNASTTGGLTVAGKATLANASATSLTVSGQSVFNTSSTTVGTVNTLFSTLANIINASTTGLTTSNLYGTNSIITNSTSTNFFATNAIFTNATTSNFFTTNFSATNGNFTGLTSVNSTSTNATSTNLFSTNAFFTNATTTNLGVLGKTTLANASGTALSLSSNLYVTGQTALTNASTTGGLTVAGKATLANASATSLTVSGQSVFNTSSTTVGTVNTLFSTLANITNASTTNTTVAGNFYLPSLTAGSIPFIGVGGVVSQDNANLYWDNTNENLGIGSSTPTANLSVRGFGATSPIVTFSSSSNAVYFNLLANGNLGLGVTTPTDKLQVAGNITPSANTTFSLGSSSLRFLNTYTQNIYASTSVMTNASTTGLTATNIYTSTLSATGQTSLANASATSLTVSGQSVFNTSSTTVGTVNTLFSTLANIINASTTGVTATNLYTSTLSATGQTSLANASATSLTISGKTTFVNASGTDLSLSSNLYVTGQTALTNASTTGGLTVAGKATLANASATSLTVSGQSVFNTSSTTVGTVNTLYTTLANITNASTTNTTVTGNFYLPSLTTGSIPFIGAGGVVSQDNANLYWDNTNENLGIGSSTPTANLSVRGFGATSPIVTFSSSSNAVYFNLLANGNLGLGVTTPTDKLQVAGNITPSANTTFSLGSSTLRFLNTYTQNIYASTSVMTNASTTGLTATNIYTSTLSATGQTSLANASATSLTISGKTTFANASGTSLTLGIGSSVAGKLTFANASNNFTTSFVSSSTQSSNLTFTLPGTLGTTDQVLATDGTGNLRFANLSGPLVTGTVGKLAMWTSASGLNSGITLDNGTVAGINATSSSYTYNIQAGANVNPFNIASSSGASLFSIDKSGNLSVQGSTLYVGVTIGNLASNGPIGTAAATVDINTTVNMNQTTAGRTFTIPAPAITTAGRILYINNNGTVGFSINNATNSLQRIEINESFQFIWDGTDWRTVGGASGDSQTTVIKSADQTRANTTMTDDTELKFYVRPNETWVVRYVIEGNSPTAADFKFAITAPSGAVCDFSMLESENSTSISNVACGVSTGLISGSGGPEPYIGSASIVNGATAGYVTLQWAEQVTSGTATVYAGSYLNAFRVSGADLAEAYPTNDATLLMGELVSLDPNLDSGVMRSTRAYDKNMVGIITTKPGLVIGDISASSMKTQALVALTGRVPVKVSTENGAIQVGDLLTSSSIPGVAMRATKAGQVIGQAMSSFDGPGTGTVVVFIKNSHFNGTNAQDFLTRDVTATSTASTTVQTSTNILTRFLEQVSFLSSLSSISEIITDRLSAALEIITPRLVTSQIATNKITTATGNDVNVELAQGERFVIQSTIPASGDGLIATSTTNVIEFDASGNATINNALKAGSIESANDALIRGNIITNGLFTNGSSSIAGNFTVGTSSQKLFFADVINRRVSVGTTTGYATFSIQGTGDETLFSVASSTGGSVLSVLANGSVGIGTSTPNATLAIVAQNNGVNPFSITTSANDSIITVDSRGFTGFGTSSPLAKVDIWGSLNVGTGTVPSFFVNTATGVVGIGNNATPLGDETLRVSGRVRATGFDIDSAADLAENFETTEAVDAGTVVAFGTSTVSWQATVGTSTNDTFEMSTVRKARTGFEAVGVVSTNPGIVLGKSVRNGVPVAFSGRIPVKVTSENGEVKQGDYLTVSLTQPGFAMKLTGEGRSIGRALSDYVIGRDKVLMIVENGIQKLDLLGKNATTTGMLTTGNVDLNANGVSITNVKALASANGTWSIDENGRIVAKQLCLEDLCIDKSTLTNLLNLSGQSGQVLGASTSTGGSSTSTANGTSTEPTVNASSTDTGTNGTSTTPVTGTTTPTDTVAPVISLIGQSTITLQQGETYIEEGATSQDVVDGDITTGIVIGGTVDTSTVGTYTITYSSTDQAGNAVTSSRSIIVEQIQPVTDTDPPVNP
jgi:hypothetical protein